jgi:ATP-dependent DNA ligase
VFRAPGSSVNRLADAKGLRFVTTDYLPVSRLSEGPEWTYKIKLDGYRLAAARSAGRTTDCASVRLDRYMRLAIISLG